MRAIIIIACASDTASAQHLIQGAPHQAPHTQHENAATGSNADGSEEVSDRSNVLNDDAHHKDVAGDASKLSWGESSYVKNVMTQAQDG